MIWRRENPPPNQPTIADLWTGRSKELSDRPTAETMRYIGRALLPHFGPLQPDKVTVETCRDYRAFRLAQGKSDGTVWTELGHLQSTLNWAQKRQLIRQAPHVWKPSKPAPQDRYLSRAEIDKVLSLEGTPHHIRLAMLLMLSTEARVSALTELTWAQVDLDRGQINLRTPGANTRKGRAIVPINDGLRAALIEARAAAISDHVIEWAGKGVNSIRKGLETALKSAVLEGVSAHVFRHTAAVHMAEAGIPMSAISQYLGHSKTSVTERVYARYSPNHLKRAASVLDFVTPKEPITND